MQQTRQRPQTKERLVHCPLERHRRAVCEGRVTALLNIAAAAAAGRGSSSSSAGRRCGRWHAPEHLASQVDGFGQTGQLHEQQHSDEDRREPVDLVFADEVHEAAGLRASF
jgi:hypothetical protein